MSIKQISVFVENKGGRLAEIANTLAENKINLRALSIADTTDFGILRIIVNNPEHTYKLLKDAGMTVSVNEVIAVLVEDTPGGLANVLSVLNRAEIAVEYIYAFIGNGDNEAYVIIRVEDNEKAEKELSAAGVPMLSPDKIG